MTEQNIARNRLFQQLLLVPHKQLEPSVIAFREAIEDDPDFIARACVYVNTPESGQKVRDIQDVACITLLQASPTFPEYREAGRCATLGKSVYPGCGMPGLPPFRIFRVERFIADSDKKAPRQMRSIIWDYFAMLEADPLRQDGVALRNRRVMKNIWRHWHFRPSDFSRCHAILFDKPPADSKLAVLKEIAGCDNPRDQARLVIQHKIPYVVATSVLPKLTPVVGVALIESMSPTEAVNSRSWLESSGLLQHPEIKDLYLAKVEKARASVASMTHRKSAKGKDEEIQAVLEEAKEKAVRESKRIERSTLILVDKSGSMEHAITAAQQFGSRIAPLCDGELMVAAFNDRAQEIKVEGKSLQDWERAFRGVRATGRTSIGAGLNLAFRQGFYPEQVVVITDTGENSYPSLVEEAQRITTRAEAPSFAFITLPGQRGHVVRDLQGVGFQVDQFETDGTDYYVYDQVAALLGGPPAVTLVDQILAVELPHRVTWMH